MASLAAIPELPRIVHQNSCIFDGELAFVDEYGGIEDANDLQEDLRQALQG